MKVKELLLTGLLVLLCAMPNVAMAADTTVTRSYPFESATQDKPIFDGGSVKTGDSGVTVAVLGLLLSAAGLTYLLRRKRHS